MHTVLGKNKPMTLIFLRFRSNANFEDFFRVQVGNMPNNWSLEKNFHHPHRSGHISNIVEISIIPNIRKYVYKGDFLNYFFQKKHDIAEQGSPKDAKSIQRCATLQIICPWLLFWWSPKWHTQYLEFSELRKCSGKFWKSNTEILRY